MTPFVVLLPGAILAFVASRMLDRYFRLYSIRYPDAAKAELLPRNATDWDARYAGRPIKFLMEAPRIVFSSSAAVGRRQADAELETLRVRAQWWGTVAIVTWAAGIVAVTALIVIGQ